MKQEEIEKAAEEYAFDTCLRLVFIDSLTEPLLSAAFKAGVDFANKHWKEIE